MKSSGWQLNDDSTTRLFSVLSSFKGEGKPLAPGQVSFAGFVHECSIILKGTVAQRAQVFHTLSNGSLDQLHLVLTNILNTQLCSQLLKKLAPHIDHWHKNSTAIDNFVLNILSALKAETDSDTLTLALLESWVTSAALAVKIIQLTAVLLILSPYSSPTDIHSYIGNEETIPDQLLVPLKITHPKIRESFSSELLNLPALMLLNSVLPYERRGFLFPLFSSREHGESFSTLCKQVLGNGPTIIVVKDKGGNVFGGFAGDSWNFHPQFTGIH